MLAMPLAPLLKSAMKVGMKRYPLPMARAGMNQHQPTMPSIPIIMLLNLKPVTLLKWIQRPAANVCMLRIQPEPMLRLTRPEPGVKK